LISIPAARSCAAILSRSRTRKFSIQTFWASSKYLLVSGKRESGGACLLLPNGVPFARWYERDSQVLLVPTPQRYRIFGSKEESSDSGHFFHFRSSSDLVTNSGPRKGRGDLWLCGCLRAATPRWFRFQMKLDPKANDRVRSSWRLRKSIPPSFREERESVYDTCATGSVKNEVLGELLATLTLPELGKGHSGAITKESANRNYG